MSLQDIRSDCADVAALLQPHVDGELADDEQERVAAHLEGCAPCRAAVAEQLWVRATLRELHREPAPQALSARIALALDAVDREAALAVQARAPRSGLSRLLTAVRSFVRFTLVMVPAAAVAVGLFVVARDDVRLGGTTQQAAMDSGLGSAITALFGGPHEPAPHEPAPHKLEVTPLDVHFGGGPGSGAPRYGVSLNGKALRDHVIDRQRPAGGPPPMGSPVIDRDGQRYLVGRGDGGEPFVHFERGGIAHFVHLDRAPHVGEGEPYEQLPMPKIRLLLDVSKQLH